VEGHDQKFFRRFAPDWCPTPLSLRTGAPTFKFVPAPLGTGLLIRRTGRLDISAFASSVLFSALENKNKVRSKAGRGQGYG